MRYDGDSQVVGGGRRAMRQQQDIAPRCTNRDQSTQKEEYVATKKMGRKLKPG